MAFQVAVAQFTPKKADVNANLDRIAELLAQASAEGAELCVFAETIVSGYFLEGGVIEVAMSAAELLAGLSLRCDQRIDALIGFYESDGGNLYNSAAYLEIGPSPRVVHVYRKFFLPTYGVFDEERFVSRGHELGVFDTRLGRVGVLICEDVWHSILSTAVALKGAQTILVPAASPARGFSGETIGNLDRYERMLRAVSEEHGVFCVNAQLAGFEGGKGFVGGSMVLDPFGEVLARSPVADDHLLMAPIDLDVVEIARSQLPLISDLRSGWSDVIRALEGV